MKSKQSMTKDEFMAILEKKEYRCDGFEIHLRNLWDRGNWRAIRYITGLDFSDVLVKPTEVSYLLTSLQ